ncbi:hypothetical protein NLI96_g3631 [Meripilus lineatus]|uniref:Uncharacterized protein n=1 Tax=Meripilus lineatus TaxID=2056292 RepID=A0AAD5V6G3_9APHY|nr:hypothetical protein NLI96_g3631 [Physisporinus lineatus]
MELHVKMTPTFYHGYILILEAILQIILKDPESEADNHTVIPTVTAVTQRLESIKESARHPDPATSEESKANTATQSQCIQAYLSSGGKVEFALDALTDSVYEKSPVGSWYSRRQYLKEEEAEFEKEVADLPRCENDLDIGVVRVKLGIPRERKGPHWFFLTDSESDEYDEDDDENGETVYEGTRSDETEQLHEVWYAPSFVYRPGALSLIDPLLRFFCTVADLFMFYGLYMRSSSCFKRSRIDHRNICARSPAL